jgi:Spy/CpxP family protein refolding chaperone
MTLTASTKAAPRLALACACVLLALGAHAQRGPGGGGGRPPGGGASPMGGSQNSGFGNPSLSRDGNRDTRSPMSTNAPPPGPAPGNAPTNSTMRGGLQLGPPGRWWDDRNFAMSIGLTQNQQRKMDNIFNSNKGAILESYKTLQKEESKLEAATREQQPDKSRIFAAIDSVNQARASLEKANAQMLLQVRQQMDPGQIARMDKFREPPPTE